jgi:predicted Zn finger-like uncharacterized protein
MVITVSCTACAASFPVDPNKVPEGGVYARCSECANIFRVERPTSEAPGSDMAVPASEAAGEVAAAREDEFLEGDPFSVGVRTEEDAGGSTAEAESGEAPEPAIGNDAMPEWASGLEEPAAEVEPLPEATGWGEVAPSDDVGSGVEPEREHASELEREPEPEAFPEPSGWAEPDSETASWTELEAQDTTEQALPDPVPAPEPLHAAEPETPVQGFTFGKRDPMDKARRLARVLVSDMVMYNSERHRQALATGTLQEDFEEEIEKSWKEFVEQVGPEIAEGEGRKFWSQALNDILAKGASVF